MCNMVVLKVLEVLLESCNYFINSCQDSLEFWLAGLERAAKSTILGHLTPVLLTAMTHPNLRCLTMADTLMSQLVQLVVLTSQVCLCVFRKLNIIIIYLLMELGFSLYYKVCGKILPQSVIICTGHKMPVMSVQYTW